MQGLFLNHPENKNYNIIIYNLKIKFSNINKNTPQEHLIYLFDNNLYELNLGMLNLLLSAKLVRQQLPEDYYKSNFSFICSCDKPSLETLENYILENINVYVEEIFLKLDKNIN